MAVISTWFGFAIKSRYMNISNVYERDIKQYCLTKVMCSASNGTKITLSIMSQVISYVTFVS